MEQTTILIIIVCWNLNMANPGSWKDKNSVPVYLPTAICTMSSTEENTIIAWGSLDCIPSYKGSIPQTMRKDYRKLWVLRDILTKSTHPP